MILPFDLSLEESHGVLVAGAGGGYDILGAVPLFTELRSRGKRVHLASLTFSVADELPSREAVSEIPNLFRVGPTCVREDVYCPEAWLSAWYASLGVDAPVWCFIKSGVVPLQQAYAHLASALQLDTIILVDGGVDAILRGDEASIGTPGEDLASLAAVSALPRVRSFIACLGFGAEMRDGISHAQVLGRIAALTRDGHFLGAASVSAATAAGTAYLSALEYVLAHQQHVRRSHVQTVVAAALDGQFGAIADATWVSPLSSLYWFFSLPGVAKAHLFLDQLRPTRTLFELNTVVDGVRKSLPLQAASQIPL